jgi:CubicO group peptidase (beta-lactamase class C family)
MPVRHLIVQISTLAIAVCACLCLAAFSVTQVGRRSIPGQSVRQRMDEIFSGFDGDVPGAAVGVVRRGKVLFQAGYGFADLQTKKRVDPETAFHLASCGKEMTAAAVLLLVEEGKVRLDDPAARYLPEMRGWADGVKIRHLLQNTSGMPDTYDALAERGGTPTDGDALRLLAQWQRLDFPPGSQYAYSDSGFDVLGELVERVSGEPFPKFMQERIFGPAGMKDTFLFDPEKLRQAKRALGYDRGMGGWTLDDSDPRNLLYGSGEVYSTIADLARYDRALFGGGLLKPASLEQMVSPGRLNDGQTLTYGFGWNVDLENESGDLYYGHSGLWMGYTAYYLHFPKDGLSVMVLSNSSDSNPEALAFDTARVFR